MTNYYLQLKAKTSHFGSLHYLKFFLSTTYAFKFLLTLFEGNCLQRFTYLVNVCFTLARIW